MLRPRLAACLQRAVGSQLRRQTEMAAPSSTVPATTFSEVKFKKEPVEDVMTELPAFNFYEIKEPEDNPYKGSTMDRSILLDPPAPVPVKGQFEFSKLENGLKIASIDRQGLTAYLGLFVSAGSRFEAAENFGVSHMVQLMSYRSTAHLSHLRTVKTLEQLGCNHTATCKADREEISYSVSVMREYVPLVVPLMVGNVLFPRLLPWEVKAATKIVKDERALFEANIDSVVSEMLHKAAYCGNTLGYAPFATDRSTPYFTPDTIRGFMLDHFAPERMALVGVNVSHAELSKWAMRSFVDYNAIPLKDREVAKSSYTGGDLRVEGPSPYCHLALALESVPWGQKELAPITLIQSILGGGSAVGGGLGSGVTSRLSKEVLQQNAMVESCAAFNTSYSDSGLFGIYGVCQPSAAGDMAASMCKALTSLSTIGEGELASAKAMLKAKLFRESEDGAALVQDMGSQLLLSGRYGSASDFATVIDGISAEQVSAAASKLLASKPTVAATGDVHAVPHVSKIEAMLQ